MATDLTPSSDNSQTCSKISMGTYCADWCNQYTCASDWCEGCIGGDTGNPDHCSYLADGGSRCLSW